MNTPITPDTFRERFALSTFDECAILVNVKTGSYFRLNASAACLCAELIRSTSIDETIANVAIHLRISKLVAHEHLRLVSEVLDGSGIRREMPEPFRYRRSKDGGYTLWHDELPALHIDELGEQLTLMSSPHALPLPLIDYVSAIAPKLLFLQGLTVLHGSSCILEGSLVGICGMSGSGKTTTATLLAKHGACLASEDVLVLGPDPSVPVIFLAGETFVNRWSVDTTQRLSEKTNGSPVSARNLIEAASGPVEPLRSIWFLDAKRRGSRFDRHRLHPCDALIQLMPNSFIGADGSASWRRHLSVSTAIASGVDPYEIELPRGLGALENALRNYATNSAS